MTAAYDRRAAPFVDRRAAGAALAACLERFAGRRDAVVLALAGGGVTVGRQVALALRIPLAVFVVRELGVPGHPETVMGAVASGNVRVLNEDVVTAFHVPRFTLEAVARQEERQLRRLERRFRNGRPLAPVAKRTVILVDDGMATGNTMRAAVLAVRELHPAHIVAAVPLGTKETCAELGEIADEVICAHTPGPREPAGLWYEESSRSRQAIDSPDDQCICRDARIISLGTSTGGRQRRASEFPPCPPKTRQHGQPQGEAPKQQRGRQRRFDGYVHES